MTVSSTELKAMLIAITIDLSKTQCAIQVDRVELHEVWEQLAIEVQEIMAGGGIVDIPWDPFD
jgi:hypothetical protein